MKKIIYLFICLFLLSCISEKKVSYTRLSGFTQGTTYHITYKDKRYRKFDEEIQGILKAVDKTLSVYNENAIVTRFNSSDKPVRINEHFRKVFYAAKLVNKNTEGAFDITIGPLVSAWGFGADKKPKNIDSALVDSLKLLLGMDMLYIQDNRIIKKNPNIQLNFNAIAQGYTVDAIADFFQKKKVRNYMVEVGGEVKAKGKNPKDTLWRIGVDKPVEGNKIPGSDLFAVIQLDNNALATSGNYRKYYIKDGVKYAHTIDPETGYPVQHKLLSVTIVANNCAVADAYATACMVKGLERSKEMVENNPQLEAFFIFNDEKGQFRTYTTKGLKENVIQ